MNDVQQNTVTRNSHASFINMFIKRWGFFLVKVVVILAAVAILSHYLPSMPAECMGIAWAVLSAIAALGIAYPLVMKKTSMQVELNNAGFLSRFNNGRTLRLIISFVLAAFLVSGLLFESQKWSIAQWAIILCSAPLYLVVTIVVEKMLKEQVAPLFQSRWVILFSGTISALLMIAIYGVVVWNSSGCLPSENLTYFYIHTPQPFLESSSCVLAELGKVTALADASTEYLVEQAASAYFPAAVVLRVVMCATTFFGIASLLGLCSLNWNEVKRIFQPLEEIDGSGGDRPVVKRYVVLVVLLAALLAGGFVFWEYKTEEAMQTGEFASVEGGIRQCVGLTVIKIDGQYYDTASLDKVREDAKAKSGELSNNAKTTLEPLINDSFDKRNENTNNYLDWYFSLASRRIDPSQEFVGEPQEYANDKFRSFIEEGIDDTTLISEFKSYANQAEALTQETESRITACRVEGLPDWLATEAKDDNSDFLLGDMDASYKIIEGYHALMDDVSEENSSKAIADKISEYASWEEPSKQLVNAVGTAKSSGESNIVIDFFDSAGQLINSTRNRGQYETEIKNCILHERTLLCEAIGISVVTE